MKLMFSIVISRIYSYFFVELYFLFFIYISLADCELFYQMSPLSVLPTPLPEKGGGGGKKKFCIFPAFLKTDGKSSLP